MRREILINQFAQYVLFLGVIIADILILSSIYYLFYQQTKIYIQLIFLCVPWYILLVIKIIPIYYINKRLVNKRIEKEVREEYSKYLSENHGC